MSVKINLFIFVIVIIINACVSKCVTTDGPSDAKVYSHIARKVVHEANWTVLGTISPIPEIKGFPMVNLVPISDGPINGRSTGYIYFLLSQQSLSLQGIKARNNVTALLTPNDQLNCRQKSKEPMCYSVMISGCATKLKIGTIAYALGLRAYITRHPEAIFSLINKDFLLYQLIVEKVFVIDAEGKAEYVSLRDYFTYN